MRNRETNEEIEEAKSSQEQLTSSKHADEIRIGGIEGGGTHSLLVIMDGKGNQLVQIPGSGTNHWGFGMTETASRINGMVERGKEALGIPLTEPLDCLGLCVSGCEEEETNQQLVQTLIDDFPNASREYVIRSDTVGSLKTGLDSGGIVLIAGTGSNALLLNSDGSTHGCGGWGYMLGDEGGAFWIAHKAAKYVFDHLDGLNKVPHAISYVWPAMRTFFHVANLNAMIPHLYSNFDKSKFASFTKEIVKGCEENDPLCLSLFTSAGQMLGRHVNALAPKANNDVKLAKGGLKVICVGSVWKSWNYMKNGFIDEIHEGKLVDELTLATLKVPSAIGACYAAGEKILCESLVRTCDKNTDVFFHYKRDNIPNKEASGMAFDSCCETIRGSAS